MGISRTPSQGSLSPDAEIRHAVGEKEYRADAQSPQWVGHLVAEKLKLSVATTRTRPDQDNPRRVERDRASLTGKPE